MKKYKYKIIFILNVLIMTFLVGMSLFNEFPIKAQAAKNINISIIDSEGGNEYFTYIDDEGNTVTLNSGTIESGTQIKLIANAEEDYQFAYWIYTLNGNIKKLSDKESVSVTVKQDYQFTAVYVHKDKVLVTFYDNGEKTILDYQIIDKGGNCTKVEIPHLKGMKTKGWDHSLKNITSNLDVKPVYKATVGSVFVDYAPEFFKGLGITLAFSVISVFLALFLGAVLCLGKVSEIKPLEIITTAYIEIIRGVPLLLQLLLIYALMPRIDYGKFLNSEIIAAILALFLNSGAYVAEIFRSGIQAVDKGQMEAGRALGLSKWQTMRKVIIPQAIKNVLPSIGNELIMVIKETSLASTVDAGIGELMSVKKQITAASFINIPPFIVIAAMYFVVTFSLSKVVGYIERRLEARD